MLTQKEVKSLKPGEYPNHVLRMMYGDKHGHVIKFNYLDEQKLIREGKFVGNRQQAKFFRENPNAMIGDYKREKEKPKFQTNRFEVAQKGRSNFGKFLDFIKDMFKFLNFSNLRTA